VKACMTYYLCANKLGYCLQKKRLAHPNCKRNTWTTQKSNRADEARKTSLGDLPWRKTSEHLLGMSQLGIEGATRILRGW
jgi:hypothetical protein